MPRRPSSKSVPRALPPCNGPQLDLFPHHQASIEWLGRLDGIDERSQATEGYVFHARIKKKEYAIKVFKFYDPNSSGYFWGPLLGSDLPLQTAAYYFDPFYSECRAYGQIKKAVQQRRLRANVAVRCHGFLLLKDNDVQLLESRYGADFRLEDMDLEFQQDAVGGCRVRAIVKDLASQETGVNKESLYRLMTGVKTLNKAKVYNKDIRIENYRDGMLVDFGSAWTEPHPPLDAMSELLASAYRGADRDLFDEMVEDEEIDNPANIGFTPNDDLCKRLRPRKKIKYPQ